MYHLIIRVSLSTMMFICFSNIIEGQDTPREIIEKSIQYHDPQGIMEDARFEFTLTETRPNGSDRYSQVTLDEGKEYCKIVRNVDGDKVETKIKNQRVKFKVNGRSKITEENIEKYRLTPERAIFMKNYYRYLWLLPKVIIDEGAIISSEYGIDHFFGKTCLQVKVTYEPEVGKDIWYFYFNQETYALEGYRFYHDEAANDGEYILLSDLTTFKSVKLPKKRQWYTHKEDKLLGEDILTKLTIK